MLKESEKERLKLSANFMNILGAGTFVTGGVAPLITAIFQTAKIDIVSASVGSLICLGIGIGLHVLARELLKRLDR